MTKKEMAEAMLAGKTLVTPYGSIAYYDEGLAPPFRFRGFGDDASAPLVSWTRDWTIKPEHKKRPMTREEVMGFLTNTPGVVARLCEGPWSFIAAFDFDGAIQDYQWAIITFDGKIGEPHAFEVDA